MTGLIGQRLTNDPARQVGRDLADLATEADHRLLALGLDLLVRRCRYPGSFVFSLLTHLGDDHRALFLGVLADLGGLVPSVCQLIDVLLARRLGLSLSPLGLLHAALDSGGAIRIRLLEIGHHLLPDHEVQDREGHQPEDELGPVGQDRECFGLGILRGRENRNGGQGVSERLHCGLLLLEAALRRPG